MPKKQKSPPCKSRLGNFVLVDKKRLSKKISQWGEGVKTKKEIEATVDVLFERLQRTSMGVK